HDLAAGRWRDRGGTHGGRGWRLRLLERLLGAGKQRYRKKVLGLAFSVGGHDSESGESPDERGGADQQLNGPATVSTHRQRDEIALDAREVHPFDLADEARFREQNGGGEAGGITFFAIPLRSRDRQALPLSEISDFIFEHFAQQRPLIQEGLVRDAENFFAVVVIVGHEQPRLKKVLDDLALTRASLPQRPEFGIAP